MNSKQFENERDFGALMALAEAMLRQGCISHKEYRKMRAIFLHRYQPLIAGLRAKST